MRGHDGFPRPQTIEGIDVTKCPMLYADAGAMEMIRAYSMFEQGILPNAGGWLDQPIKFVQAMTIIGNQVDKMREEKSSEKS